MTRTMHQIQRMIVTSRLALKTPCGTSEISRFFKRCFATSKPAIVLGIETSCDDTGLAIVESTGKILGEALDSQLVFHLGEGGINPPNARDLHKLNIQRVYEECLESANMTLDDVDAIAVTTEPGLPLSLIIGRDFALELSRKANKPVIPIHHMHAHALTARMVEKVDFPFLTLLISGGHSILALAQDIDQFKILGSTLDDAPGECFDKVARRLKLINIFEYAEVCGGEAIESAARKADNPDQFDFPVVMSHYRDCMFSFGGLKTTAYRHIEKQEDLHNIRGADIIPGYKNLCASYITMMARHMCMRTQRAIEFLDRKELMPEGKRTLVVSGGVASNKMITNALNKVCLETGYRLVKPPPKLCTDNGIMVAWNGAEKYMANKGVIRDKTEIDKIDIAHRTPMGEDWCKIVANEGIRCKFVKPKFNELL